MENPLEHMSQSQERRCYLIRMIELVGVFEPGAETCGAFTNAVSIAADPQVAHHDAINRLMECGFKIVCDGEEVVDVTGWEDLDPSIQRAIERAQESGEVEFGDFETFPLDK